MIPALTILASKSTYFIIYVSPSLLAQQSEQALNIDHHSGESEWQNVQELSLRGFAMATSLYDLSVASYLQTAGAVAGFLDRAAKQCAEMGSVRVRRNAPYWPRRRHA